jgi:hypothetical protein
MCAREWLLQQRAGDGCAPHGWQVLKRLALLHYIGTPELK